MTSITRRRGGEELTAAIHDAVRQQLHAEGYRGVTFEGVARVARATRPVLYRRYRSRAHMVVEAITPQVSAIAPGPLPGALREDVIALMESARDRFRAVGPDTYRGLVAEADHELLARISLFTQEVGDEIARTVITAAVTRGELGSTDISDRVKMLPVVLLRNEFLLGDGDDEAIEQIVDDIYLPLLRAVAGPGRQRRKA
jgi:AcrR family transcriptional regulator